MAILTLSISKSKITGLNRVLDVNSLNITSDVIQLQNIVFSLDSDGNRLNTQEISPYTVLESADNNTHVDPSTGIYVLQQEDLTWKYIAGPNKDQLFTGSPMGEYDFLIALFNQNVNIENLVRQYIQLNDSIGKYDV